MANVGTLTAKLTADTSGFISGMGRASKAAASAVGAIAKIGAVAVGVATAVAGVSTKMSGDFESAIVSAGAKSSATAEQLEQMRSKAIQVGLDTAFSAQQAADGMGVLAQAGFTVEQQMAAVQPITNLAAAEQLNLAQATETATGVLGGFQLAVSKTAHVTDVLAWASSNSKTNAQELGQAMSYVAPSAHAMGVSMEETAAAAAVLAEAQIKGSRAGTTLRGTLGQMLKVSDDLGAGLTSAKIQSLGLGGSLEVLQRHGLTAANAMERFGTEAGPGVAQLLTAGTDKLDELTQKMREAGGTAEAIAQKQLNTFNGQMTKLRGTVETAAIMLGGVFTRAAAPFIESMTGAINKSLKGQGAFKGLVITLAKGLIPVLGNLSSNLRPFVPLMDGVVRASSAFAKALRIVWRVVQILAKVVAGLVTAIGVGLLEAFEKIVGGAASAARFLGQHGMANSLDAAASAMNGLGNETTEWLKSMKGSDHDKLVDIGRQFVGIWDDLSTDQQEKLNGLLEKAAEGGKAAKKALEEYVKELEKVDKVSSEAVGKAPAPFTPKDAAAAGAAAASRGGGKKRSSEVVDLAKYQGQAKLDRMRRGLLGMGPSPERAGLQRQVEMQELLNRVRAKRLEIEQKLKAGDISEKLATAQKQAVYQNALTEKAGIEQRHRENIADAQDRALQKQRQQTAELNRTIGAAGSLTNEVLGLAGASQQVTQAMSGAFGAIQQTMTLMDSFSWSGALGLAGTVLGVIGSLFGGSTSGGSSRSPNQKQEQNDFIKRFVDEMERREVLKDVTVIDARGAGSTSQQQNDDEAMIRRLRDNYGIDLNSLRGVA